MKHGDFTQLADQYAKYRPGYSPLVLRAMLGLVGGEQAELSIVDAGAGTGIWSRAMLGSNRTLTAVEPNDAMREQGMGITAKDKDGIIWVKGSAESTSLPDASADIVTMASSFHWPDFDSAVREFYRILKPGGIFMALWNTRHIESSPALVEIEETLKEMVPELKRVSSGRSEFCDGLFESLEARKEFSEVLYLEGRHTEQQSLERYLGLWRSVNDVRVQAGEKRFQEFIHFIETKLADVDTICADYTTRAWIAQRA